MRFRDVSQAVSFADEILNRPTVKSAHSVLTGVRGKGQDIDEVRDTAHTISLELANIDDKAASLVYRYLHGKGTMRILSEATMLISRRWLKTNNDDEFKDMPAYIIRSITLAIIKQEREVVRGGNRSFAKIGRLVGVKDGKAFRRQYRDLVISIREDIFSMVESAERHMTLKLTELDLFE